MISVTADLYTRSQTCTYFTHTLTQAHAQLIGFTSLVADWMPRRLTVASLVQLGWSQRDTCTVVKVVEDQKRSATLGGGIVHLLSVVCEHNA